MQKKRRDFILWHSTYNLYLRKKSAILSVPITNKKVKKGHFSPLHNYL